MPSRRYIPLAIDIRHPFGYSHASCATHAKCFPFSWHLCSGTSCATMASATGQVRGAGAKQKQKTQRPESRESFHHISWIVPGLELLICWTALMTHEGHTPPGMSGKAPCNPGTLNKCKLADYTDLTFPTSNRSKK